jgi:hypothetical protein
MFYADNYLIKNTKLVLYLIYYKKNMRKQVE